MGKAGIMAFLREQLATVPPVETADLNGKTVMVIGANVGLGLEATKHFARMNPARLILACRSRSKGEAAIQKIQQETGYEAAELWIVDLSEFSSVVAFADKFEKDGGRLDILLANAAVLPGKYMSTSDGWERTQLSLSLPHRLALASAANQDKRGTFNTPAFGDKDIYKTLSNERNISERYNDSKLFGVLFYQALNEKLGTQCSLIVNGVNPGFCVSEIRKELSGVVRAVSWLMEKTIVRTTEEGSRQLVYAAIGGKDKEDQLRGAYISLARISEASDFAISGEGHVVQEKLWEEVMDILGKIDPSIEGVAKKYLVRA
ncbi:hypothetical protein C0993_010531 [Termitomyces sp. T159_Od127]|nr:hypothetical protein C0993_010531 [Termitomyces sp. T159_Od127]